MKPLTTPTILGVLLALSVALGGVAAQTPGSVHASQALPVQPSTRLPDASNETALVRDAGADLPHLPLEVRLHAEAHLGEEAGYAASSDGLAAQAPRDMPVIAAAGSVAAAGLLFSFWHIVRLLLGAATISPLFSRTEGKQVLENATRSQIHQAICENPGLCLRDLQALLGVGWSTIVYHVARLESARLIISRRYRQFRRFYKNGSGIPEAERTAAAELTNGTSKRLAVAVAQRPGQIQRDLCERVGVRPPVAHKYLARLEQAQLLTSERADGTVRYYPTPELHTLVQGESAAWQPHGHVQLVTA